MQIIVSLNRVRCGSYVQAPLMGVLFIQWQYARGKILKLFLNWKLPVQDNLIKGILALELSLRIYFCYADLDYGQQLGGTGNFAYTLCECRLLS